MRGEAVLRAVENAFLRLERFSSRFLPDAVNPLLHTGALANSSLVVALVTGGLLLFWYSPSVHFAYASMQAMEAAFLPRLVRSLHRYSSDVCVLFVALHAARLVAARRFSGARWLAWVTGLISVALLWLVGWTGYWLVWDERAAAVAVGTARFLDRLPVFVDSMESTFVADATVGSLLFFIVFFVHMLIPMAMGVVLWLHIARLQRPKFLANRAVSVALVVGLVVLSVALPAQVAAPARLGIFSTGFSIDAWYLVPLWLTDRLSADALWALTVLATALLAVAPWASTKARARPATIIAERCSGCEHCVQDCPYEAISLVPRTDGKPYSHVALVDPSRCLGCGICNASCATAGSGLPHFDTLAQRDVVEAWVDSAPQDDKPLIAFLCHDASSLAVDVESGLCADLPGYRVLQVPCAGWVHAITVERLLRKGAPGVLIVGCAGTCRFREGLSWTEGRMAGTHDTPLADRVDKSRLRVLAFHRLERERLCTEAAAFRRHEGRKTGRALPVWVGAAVTTLAWGGLTYALSQVPYTPPVNESARLAITFKHPGAVSERCQTLSPEEQAKLPVHMRRDKDCQRARQKVRLKVLIDGVATLEKAYAPSGMWSDGASVVFEEFDVPSGPHQLKLLIGDDGDESTWAYVGERIVHFAVGERRAVVFDRTAGFGWH